MKNLLFLLLLSSAFAVSDPKPVHVSVVGSSAVLSWDAVPGATTYSVWKPCSPCNYGFQWIKYDTITATTYTFDNLTLGSFYSFSVTSDANGGINTGGTTVSFYLVPPCDAASCTYNVSGLVNWYSETTPLRQFQISFDQGVYSSWIQGSTSTWPAACTGQTIPPNGFMFLKMNPVEGTVPKLAPDYSSTCVPLDSLTFSPATVLTNCSTNLRPPSAVAKFSGTDLNGVAFLGEFDMNFAYRRRTVRPYGCLRAITSGSLTISK